MKTCKGTAEYECKNRPHKPKVVVTVDRNGDKQVEVTKYRWCSVCWNQLRVKRLSPYMKRLRHSLPLAGGVDMETSYPFSDR